MVLKYVISDYPSLLENLYARIWEAESDGPGAHVRETLISAPHTTPVVLTFNGLDKVVHIVRLVGAISGHVYHEYNEEPKEDVVEMFDPIKFKMGDGNPLTPAVGTSTYTNPVLLGLGNDDYLVHRNGYGYLFPDVHYTTNPGAGSFSLIGGDQFGPDEEFVIQKKYKTIANPVHDSVVGKLFGGFVDVAAPLIWDAAHLRKLVRFSGSTTYEFPAGQAIPIGYIHSFTHLGNYSGGSGTGQILFNNFPLKWGNTTKAILDVPSFTEVGVTFDGAFWNIVYMSDSRFVNAGAQQPGTIIGYGTYLINKPGYTNGDLPGGDNSWFVQHNLNIVGDYMVMLTVKSNNSATYGMNNRVTTCWWHDETVEKKNRFWFSAEENIPQPQNISINYLIIKL